MSDTEQNPERRIALFQRKEIRRTIHNNEWWFVITDVVAALTDSVDPQGYIRDMRRRDPELSKEGANATPLLIPTAGGPQKLNCANTEGLFRIIQSIPSPKAEPFKRWLAHVGYEGCKVTPYLYERLNRRSMPVSGAARTKQKIRWNQGKRSWVFNLLRLGQSRSRYSVQLHPATNASRSPSCF